MNDNQFSNPNSVNEFLDSMEGSAQADPFAEAQKGFAPQAQDTGSQAYMQPAPAIQPATAWPAEQQPAANPVRIPQAPTMQIPQQAAPAENPPQMAILNPAMVSSDNEEAPVDPFTAALSQAKAASEERLIGTLSAKQPLFCYGKAKDPIDDPEATFEDVRQKYEADFPELSESKLVTWSVAYGKITKQISNPASDKVYLVKSEIEKSKSFIDALKKAKTDAEKQPECLVKPFKKAQSKGELKFPAYKEFCFSKADALKSEKPIAVLPSKDGRLYEIRKNEIGIFIAGTDSLPELTDVCPDFTFTLPKIPFEILRKILSFFKQMSDQYAFEALVHILYDVSADKYVIRIPKQRITHTTVNSDSEEYDDNLIHVMDLHSHNNMPAVFSDTDDRDETGTRLYAVAGRFDKPFPDLNIRAGCAGKFIPLHPEKVFDLQSVCCEYPREWENCLDLPVTPLNDDAPRYNFVKRLKLKGLVKKAVRGGIL